MSDIHIIEGPAEEEKKKEIGSLFEKIVEENFPNLAKEIDTQVQKAQSPQQDGCKEAQSKSRQRLKIKREEVGMREWVRGEGIKKYK